ncbi:MAG: hypothetical protein KAT65_02520 [Methanophagales archaeon]|nr:hypothetical protein [Methanophagales archaeon]
MSEECTDEGCAVSIEPVIEPVSEEEKKEKLPESAEIATVLGTLTASCDLMPQESKSSCFSKIEPLEQKTKSAKETLKDIIAEHGEEELKRSIEALEDLVEEAKVELKREGKI